MKAVPTVSAAVIEADLLLFLVGHTQFRNLDPQQVAENSKARTVFDTADILENRWETAGFKVYRLGNELQWAN